MKNIIIGGTHGLGQEIAKRLQVLGEETYVVGRSHDKARHGDGLKVDLSSTKEAQLAAIKLAPMKQCMYDCCRPRARYSFL